MVDVTDLDWEEQYLTAMATQGTVLLVAANGQRARLGRALRVVAALPIERASIRVFGRLLELTRDAKQLRAQITIAEDLQ